MKLDVYDLAWLAHRAVDGKDSDLVDGEPNLDGLEDAVGDTFGIELDSFNAVAAALLRFTPVVASRLDGGKLYHAFGTTKVAGDRAIFTAIVNCPHEDAP